MEISQVLNELTRSLIRYSFTDKRDSLIPNRPLLAWPGARKTEAAAAQESSPELRALGTREFSIKDSPVRVGDSGLTVTVSDLSLAPADQKVTVGGKNYILPSYSAMGKATITGTAIQDRLTVSQDSDGNTILDVQGAGAARVNLGKIAALTLYGMGGDDQIAVTTKNYFGGITIEAGDGGDTVTIQSDYSMKKGVTISGGNGDDIIALSGKALSVLVQGDDGADSIDIRQVKADAELTRRLHGGGGSDILYGSDGANTLWGDDGSDTLIGGNGGNVLYGGDGNDALFGGSLADMLDGGAGNDVLTGNAGDDSLFGGEGSDTLMGGDGDDMLWGDAGDDFLYAGAGNDVLWGGDGADNLAPLAHSKDEIFATAQTAGYVQVNVRGADRRQLKLAAYPSGDKALADYDNTTDFLVDINYLA